MRFDWDSDKAASNLKKHGVSFEEAVTAFADPFALYSADPNYLERTRVIAMSAQSRLLFCVFVERDGDVFRIIKCAQRDQA